MRRSSTSERRMTLFRMTCCFISYNTLGSEVTYYRFLGPHTAKHVPGAYRGVARPTLRPYSTPTGPSTGLSGVSNIFINDIFSGATALGCEVPGLRSALSQSPVVIPGLLFADDAVATTPSLDSLECMLDHLSEWARDHFMGVWNP